MLNGIHIVDFGNHRDTELRFGKFTALVGQNGAGKTNVMRAIRALSNTAGKIRFANLSGYGRIGGKKTKIAAGWYVKFWDYEGEGHGDRGVEISDGSMHKWYWRKRVAKGDVPWIPGFQRNSPGPGKDKMHRVFEPGNPPDLRPGEILEITGSSVPRLQWSSNYFKLSSERLRGASYTEVNPPTLLEDGSEFAWTLAYLMTAKPECFREIMDALREIVPMVKNVRAQPARIARIERKSVTINRQEHAYDEEQAVMGQELIFDMVSGSGQPASFVSDGTLIVLAILTAIIHGNSESEMKTILLDDIEQGLHPKAQRDLIRQLRRLQEVRPELQIIVSSHSPYVVDELAPEDVWLFAPDKEGCAAYARLSDHPDVNRALKVLTTGEFWSSEGEEWVLDSKKRAHHREKQPVS